jgi:hypothetical protein
LLTKEERLVEKVLVVFCFGVRMVSFAGNEWPKSEIGMSTVWRQPHHLRGASPALKLCRARVSQADVVLSRLDVAKGAERFNV